jgi:aspartate-semialdehyde dehydrogenase
VTLALPCSIVGFGAVGKLLATVIRERRLPVKPPRVFARTPRVASHDGAEYVVEALAEGAFDEGGLVFFAGPEGEGNVSETWGPKAVDAGAWVIDNSSTFRMRPDVPLVVPEVNADALNAGQRLIANPNCSTIQMVVALAPIHRVARIRRIVVSTYQSTSGAGGAAVDVLNREAAAALAGAGAKDPDSPFAAQIAFNCVPIIGGADDTGYTSEERKMVHETRKILGDPSIRVSATTVRVSVAVGHSECVNLELAKPLSPEEARELLAGSPGVVVVDSMDPLTAPTPLETAGRDEVFVGRIRRDTSVEHGLDLWVVADNLRKGAATNAVQIAEELLARGLVKA